MEILSIDADQKLVNVASAIGRHPQSWEGWFCLHIQLHDVQEDLYQDCVLWTKSIVESYLKGVEGRVHFCSNQSVHILGQTLAPQILHQTGQQICDLLLHENGIVALYTVYDLAIDGFLYAQGVLEDADNILALPVVRQTKIKSVPLEKINISNDTQSGDQVKVLLVEDDPITRWMVRNTLKHACEFVTAPTMNKAFGMYNAYQPDLVFLDINLPDGSGYTVLEWIMRNDPGAAVVMFSSNNNLDNISDALDEGASGFIAKPFSKENLLHYIHNHTACLQ